MTETLGGSTTFVSGTTLPPVTITVTPVVYPSTTASTHDSNVNKKTVHWTSDTPASPTASKGCSGCGGGCKYTTHNIPVIPMTKRAHYFTL